MTSLSRVVWSEGMYLGPHHFQAQNRYFEESVRFTVENLWFAPWGLLGYELDQEALRNGTLALVHARGLFPDGLPFQMPEHDELPPARRVADLFPPLRDSIGVSLAVPRYQPDNVNCALEPSSGAPAAARYVAAQVDLPDENTGRDAKPVQIGRKNIRFVLDTETVEDAVALPLTRILRDPTGQFVYDARVIPPSLQIGASERLMLILARLIDVLGEKAHAVVSPKDLSAGAASGFSAEGIANAWFLHCVNSSIGPLTHLLQGRRAHPEELFGELSRLAGSLCTFSLDSHPAQLPLYKHEALTECFETLDKHIRTHLELVVPSNRVLVPLERVARFFYTGKINDARTVGRARWIFGIRCGIGESDLIESTPRLVKICSREFIPRLVERALPGLKMTHLPVPPPALTPKIDFQYFAVDRAGPCWEHMVKTREVGVYVPGELPEPEIEVSVILES
jgi:type VI secretion system protein ImpJ